MRPTCKISGRWVDDWKTVHAAMAHHPWASPHKPTILIQLTTLTKTSVQIASSNGRWFSDRDYSLSHYLKRPTTRQQENARAPLASQEKKSLGAQHALRGGGVGLVHLEVNRDPQYNGASRAPMCLSGLPSHNNSRAEKLFQAFKLLDNKPSMGRRHGTRRKGTAIRHHFHRKK